ncbi:MAG TPA: DUF362 domain-containing protein [Phycisphaerae bacterium]|nr:DUF362 domain-containing protein [Phycisphaerae bacterium]
MVHLHDRGPEPPHGLPSPEDHLTLPEICADFARRNDVLSHRAAACGMTRRELLASLAAGAAAAVSGAGAWAAAGEPLPKSRVVLVTHPEVIIKDYRVNPPIVRQMLDRAVVELTGKPTESEAWAHLGRQDDCVAVKHNSIGAPTLHSHTEINETVASRLAADAKVDPKRIHVVDRILPAPHNELSDPFTLRSSGLKTRLRRLYTDTATAIVNVSVLKSHVGTGISAAMKNHLGSVNNPAAYHGWEPDRMPRSLPELSALTPLRTKTRLVIIDAIRPLFASGPADDPDYRWDARSLIVATDPVAATAVGLRMLEKQRAAVRGKPWPMTAARQMVAWGQVIGLGNADPGRIDLVQVDMA